jgi:integrase
MKVPSEARYIADAQAIFRTRFPNDSFDDCSWDIRHLRASQHKKTNARVYFTKYGSTTDPLPARFARVVKACFLLMNASVGTLPLRADAARMLWRAIEVRRRHLRDAFSWSDVTEEDVLETEQQMLKSWGRAATYKRCTMLKRMFNALAATPYGGITRPISVTFRTTRQEDFERYTLEGQELRRAKMPSEEAIYAIGDMFSGLVANERDRLVVCALAILVATGLRVGEVLTAPFECEASEGSGHFRRDGLRYYKEKSRGGEKRLAVHWMTVRQAELVRAAISQVRGLTTLARERARILEATPDVVPLPGISPDDLLTAERVAQLLGYKPDSINAISAAKLPRRHSEQPNRPHSMYRASDVMAYLHSIRNPLWIVDPSTDGMGPSKCFRRASSSGFITPAIPPKG